MLTHTEIKDVVSAGCVLQRICHDASKSAGWWVAADGTPVANNPYAFSNKLALIHSEISEAMEGDRKSLKDDKLPNRDMREVELADAVIRIFDLAGAYDMDLGGAIAEKMAYNAQRADHKPEARAAAGGKAY
jgi:NTP pyrophosphatase (non-canonical NTP hydrolase)